MERSSVSCVVKINCAPSGLLCLLWKFARIYWTSKGWSAVSISSIKRRPPVSRAFSISGASAINCRVPSDSSSNPSGNKSEVPSFKIPGWNEVALTSRRRSCASLSLRLLRSACRNCERAVFTSSGSVSGKAVSANFL